jgi:hypothetical protein
MGEIQKIVRNYQVIRLVMEVPGLHTPRGMLEHGDIGNQSGVGIIRVTHPDEYPPGRFRNGIRFQLKTGGDGVLSGDLDATPLPIVFEAMVHTAHAVAFFASDRQGCMSMATSISQCDHPSIRRSVEQHRFSQDGARK